MVKAFFASIRQSVDNLCYIGRILVRTAPLFLVLTLLVSLFSGLGNVGQSYFISRILDEILAGGPFAVIAGYAIAIVLMQLLSKVQARTLFALNRVVTEEIGVRMESGILERTAKIPVSKMDEPGFLNRLEQAGNLAKRTPNSVFMLLFGGVSLLAGTVGYIVILGRIGFFHVLILAVCSVFIVMENHRYEENVMSSLFAMSPARRRMAYFSNLLIGREHFEEIRTYGASEYLQGEYRRNAHRQIDESRRIFRRYSILYALAACVAYAGCALVYLLILARALRGEISVGDTAMFLTACLGFQSCLTELTDGLCALPPQLRTLQNYRDLIAELDQTAEGAAGSDRKPEDAGHALIAAKALSFAYPHARRKVLQNVNFRIERGECVALVGTNGSGKTTLVRLLAGLYDQYEGVLEINGVEGRNLRIDERRKSVAVMFQNYVKPSLTVGEAVRLGATEPENEQKIREALEKSAYPLADLPRGIHTALTRDFDGDGFVPSGGQWQKIALARMFYRDTDLYILDEPSAALDPKAEDEVFRLLFGMKGRKTILFITHRLASVSIADKILYLTPEGKLIQGTHDELMAGCPAYRELYRAQAEKYRL